MQNQYKPKFLLIWILNNIRIVEYQNSMSLENEFNCIIPILNDGGNFLIVTSNSGKNAIVHQRYQSQVTQQARIYKQAQIINCQSLSNHGLKLTTLGQYDILFLAKLAQGQQIDLIKKILRIAEIRQVYPFTLFHDHKQVIKYSQNSLEQAILRKIEKQIIKAGQQKYCLSNIFLFSYTCLCLLASSQPKGLNQILLDQEWLLKKKYQNDTTIDKSLALILKTGLLAQNQINFKMIEHSLMIIEEKTSCYILENLYTNLSNHQKNDKSDLLKNQKQSNTQTVTKNFQRPISNSFQRLKHSNSVDSFKTSVNRKNRKYKKCLFKQPHNKSVHEKLPENQNSSKDLFGYSKYVSTCHEDFPISRKPKTSQKNIKAEIQDKYSKKWYKNSQFQQSGTFSNIQFQFPRKGSIEDNICEKIQTASFLKSEADVKISICENLDKMNVQQQSIYVWKPKKYKNSQISQISINKTNNLALNSKVVSLRLQSPRKKKLTLNNMTVCVNENLRVLQNINTQQTIQTKTDINVYKKIADKNFQRSSQDIQIMDTTIRHKKNINMNVSLAQISNISESFNMSNSQLTNNSTAKLSPGQKINSFIFQIVKKMRNRFGAQFYDERFPLALYVLLQKSEQLYSSQQNIDQAVLSQLQKQTQIKREAIVTKAKQLLHKKQQQLYLSTLTSNKRFTNKECIQILEDHFIKITSFISKYKADLINQKNMNFISYLGYLYQLAIVIKMLENPKVYIPIKKQLNKNLERLSKLKEQQLALISIKSQADNALTFAENVYAVKS